MKKNAPPPPEILRKSGPHKDRAKYDRKRVTEEDQKRETGRDPDEKPARD
jgi:hypothetical protein